MCKLQLTSLNLCLIINHLLNEPTPVYLLLIPAREKLAVCDVTNLPYMDINWQFISIYHDFVTSLPAYYSCADISNSKLCYTFNSKLELKGGGGVMPVILETSLLRYELKG